MTIQSRRFDEPDEVLELGDKGRSDVLTVSDLLVVRSILEPGWSWVEHVKPTTEGLESCPLHHREYVVAGTIRYDLVDDGGSIEAGTSTSNQGISPPSWAMRHVYRSTSARTGASSRTEPGSHLSVSVPRFSLVRAGSGSRDPPDERRARRRTGGSPRRPRHIQRRVNRGGRGSHGTASSRGSRRSAHSRPRRRSTKG
jgi:hypothetical protein